MLVTICSRLKIFGISCKDLLCFTLKVKYLKSVHLFVVLTCLIFIISCMKLVVFAVFWSLIKRLVSCSM